MSALKKRALDSPDKGSPSIEPTELTSSALEHPNLLLVKRAMPAEVLNFATQKRATQIIQETNLDYDLELKASRAMLETPSHFLDFPLSTILTPHSVSSVDELGHQRLELSFHKSQQKGEVLRSVTEFLGSVPKARKVRDGVIMVADELFTNAIYNAPFVKQDALVSRTQDVVLNDDSKAVRITLGASETRLVLVCQDNYGSLDVEMILNRIKSCYEKGAAQMINPSEQNGGAGIGSYIIFESCMALYYGVQKDKRTVVACVFPLGAAARDWDSDLKNIHYVTI